MSEEQKTPESPKSTPQKGVDSFGNPVEKSPWLIYALLQIPLVIIMIVILYFMYQSRQN